MRANTQIREHGIANPAVLADQIGPAPHADAERAIELVCLDDLLAGVRQQREVEVVLLGESPVRVGVLRADTHHPQPCLEEILVQVAEAAGFLRRSEERRVGNEWRCGWRKEAYREG